MPCEYQSRCRGNCGESPLVPSEPEYVGSMGSPQSTYTSASGAPYIGNEQQEW